MVLIVSVCVRAQGCSESSVGVAAYSWIDMAVWRLGAFLSCHGLHLHHPQLPAGTHAHQHTHTHIDTHLVFLELKS